MATTTIKRFGFANGTDVLGGSFIPFDVDLQVSDGTHTVVAKLTYVGGGTSWDMWLYDGSVWQSRYLCIPTGTMTLTYNNISGTIPMGSSVFIDTPLPLSGKSSSLTKWNLTILTDGVQTDSKDFTFTATWPGPYPTWTVTSIVPYAPVIGYPSPACCGGSDVGCSAMPFVATIQCNQVSPKNLLAGMTIGGTAVVLNEPIHIYMKGMSQVIYTFSVVGCWSSLPGPGTYDLNGLATPMEFPLP